MPESDILPAPDIFHDGNAAAHVSSDHIEANEASPAGQVRDLPEVAYREDFWQRSWEIQAGSADW